MRKRIVSRTIVVNTLEVTLFDKAQRGIITETIVITGEFLEKHLVARAKKAYQTNDNYTVCDVKIKGTFAELRYMDEEEFYRLSKLAESTDEKEVSQ